MEAKTIKDIRLHNARLLQDSVGGQKGMIEKTGRSQSQISSLMGETAWKPIGPKIARALETDFGLPEGWMDIWHDSLNDSPQATPNTKAIEPPIFPGTQRFIEVPIFDVELAAGAGTAIDLEHVKDSVPISSDWIIEQNLNQHSLAAVFVAGDSMAPRLQDGDTILVDRSDRQLVSGKVYAIAVDGELRVKRMLKRFDGNWVISSDNKQDPTYQDEVVAHYNIDQLRVIGKVVKVIMGDV